MTDNIEGYMCKTDFDYELGNASGGNVIYPSLENLQNHRRCWKTCGVVRVSVKFEEVVIEEELDIDDD